MKPSFEQSSLIVSVPYLLMKIDKCLHLAGLKLQLYRVPTEQSILIAV